MELHREIVKLKAELKQEILDELTPIVMQHSGDVRNSNTVQQKTLESAVENALTKMKNDMDALTKKLWPKKILYTFMAFVGGLIMSNLSVLIYLITKSWT